jgi:hypothetical protein
MKWIEISRQERDVLRDEVRTKWGTGFGSLQAMVEGRVAADRQAYTAAAMVLPVLNAIGWEVDRDDEFYELPDCDEINDFLSAARSRTRHAITEFETCREQGERLNGKFADERRVAAVCEAILNRPSKSDPVIDRAMASLTTTVAAHGLGAER